MYQEVTGLIEQARRKMIGLASISSDHAAEIVLVAAADELSDEWGEFGKCQFGIGAEEAWCSEGSARAESATS